MNWEVRFRHKKFLEVLALTGELHHIKKQNLSSSSDHLIITNNFLAQLKKFFHRILSVDHQKDHLIENEKPRCMLQKL